MSLCTQETGSTILGKPFVLLGYLFVFFAKSVALFGLMYLVAPILFIFTFGIRLFYKFNVCEVLGILYLAYNEIDGGDPWESVVGGIMSGFMILMLADIFGLI